jgi:hypothetical protein
MKSYKTIIRKRMIEGRRRDTVPTRDIYVPWDAALEGQKTTLEGLAKWTSVDTIMLSDGYTPRSKRMATHRVEQLVLPSTNAFRVDVTGTTRAKFDEMRAFMDLTHSMKFKVLCLAAPIFIAGGKGSMACIDLTGRHVLGPGGFGVYGCPNNPETNEYGETYVRELIDSWPALDLLSLDHIEYPINLFAYWPKVDIRYLFVCFCDSCQMRTSKEGLDLARVRDEIRSILARIDSRRAEVQDGSRDLRSFNLLNFLLRHPLLTTWLAFRMRSMTDYARRLVRAARAAAKKSNPTLKVGFYTQLPTLSNLVGTDYETLHPLFDYMCPKFPDYLPGSIIPIVADELAKGRSWNKDELRLMIRRVLELGPGPRRYESLGRLEHALLYSNTFDASIIERQMKYIEHLTKETLIIPHVWGDANGLDGLRKKMATLRRLGFDSYTAWIFGDFLEEGQAMKVRGIL